MTTINYRASTTLKAFHKSPSLIRGIKGPIGSGKSVACCIEGYRLSSQVQLPNSDGVRKSRGLIVRNTLPELETTTMKTWKDWFPPGDPNKGFFGRMTGKPPYTHFIKQNLSDGTSLDMEVQFIALDRPEDAKKLLSYECSWIWFNEAREIEKSIIDAATGRIGRYPSIKDGGCTRKAILLDTNSPDDSHWWFNMAEEDAWLLDENGNMRDLDDIPPESRWEFFTQPSGMSEDAENLENLQQLPTWQEMSMQERRDQGRKYYTDMISGKTKEWLSVYVHGNYGFIKKGQPVFAAEWSPSLHKAKEELKVIPGAKIAIGVDSSGRHPAAVAWQRTARGQWQAIEEVCVTSDEGMGAKNFAKLLKAWTMQYFPNSDIQFWGDPAGAWGSQNDEQTYFDILRGEGIPILGSPGLRISERVEAVKSILSRMVDGQPAYLVSPRCKMLIRGFEGGYSYRKLQVSGDTRFAEKPEKNRFSDIHDANQYVACGIGELMMGRGAKLHGQGIQTHNCEDKTWTV